MILSYYLKEKYFNFKIYPFHLSVQLTDIMCNEYPRVRLDRVRRPTKIVWDGPPTLQEEPEDSDTSCPMDIALNTTMYSEIGKCLIIIDELEL